jgi:DNA-binding transcriptional LysR family regulator
MLEFSELRAFRAVVKHLNFSKAAKEIGVSPPQLTKIIIQLEEKLKCKLLIRSTRNVRLTSEGASFLTVAVKAIDAVVVAEELFEDQNSPKALSGTIKMTAPNTLGIRLLAEPLKEFHQKFPNVKVEILLEDSYLDFIEHDIDIALRVMKPLDSSLIAKKVANNPVSFYATPEYLKKNGPPLTVQDLSLHPVFCIPQHHKLKFKKAKLELGDVILRPDIQCTNGDLLISLAVLGMGVIARSEWGVQKEVQIGQLKKLNLDDELISHTGVYIVYPQNKFLLARVKAFIDILAKIKI